jgi:2,4-dienoyl-CoA reductase-like NADH-dependent reductase (Old Yellow Enzyme family)
VAHYFKFKSAVELGAATSRLGLGLPLQDDLAPLFQPTSIGPYRAGNRLCIQPMEGCDGTLDGKPDELTFRRYHRFGAGGAKLIWGEAVAVVAEGRANPRQLLASQAHAADLERMLKECRQAHREAFGHDDDLVVGLQLTHSGRYSHLRPLIACHDPLLDPRCELDDAYPLLTDAELERLEDHYLAAARLAFKVGFQFVDVKQCHRYLLNELLASRTRPGRYGGSLENRTRFARNVIGRIRDEVPGAVIATRINLFDGVPYRKGTNGVGEPEPWPEPVQSCWGTNEANPLEPDLTEPLAWIGEMQRLGVALLNVSLGNPYASPHLGRPYEYPPPDGYETPEHPLVGVARHFDLAATVQ